MPSPKCGDLRPAINSQLKSSCLFFKQQQKSRQCGQRYAFRAQIYGTTSDELHCTPDFANGGLAQAKPSGGPSLNCVGATQSHLPFFISTTSANLGSGRK